MPRPDHGDYLAALRLEDLGRKVDVPLVNEHLLCRGEVGGKLLHHALEHVFLLQLLDVLRASFSSLKTRGEHRREHLHFPQSCVRAHARRSVTWMLRSHREKGIPISWDSLHRGEHLFPGFTPRSFPSLR